MRHRTWNSSQGSVSPLLKAGQLALEVFAPPGALFMAAVVIFSVIGRDFYTISISLKQQKQEWSSWLFSNELFLFFVLILYDIDTIFDIDTKFICIKYWYWYAWYWYMILVRYLNWYDIDIYRIDIWYMIDIFDIGLILILTQYWYWYDIYMIDIDIDKILIWLILIYDCYSDIDIYTIDIDTI